MNILAVLGGKTTKDAVKRMLGRILRKSLALQINWTGAGGKVAFKSLHLKNVLHSKLKKNKTFFYILNHYCEVFTTPGKSIFFLLTPCFTTGAVRRVVHTATEEDLQKEVAMYLKGAADREGGRKDRQKKVGNGEMGNI